METVLHARSGRRPMAIRVVIVLAGVLTVLLLSWRPASAQPVSAYPPPPPSSTPSFSSGNDGESDVSGSDTSGAAAGTSPQIITRPLASTGSDTVLMVTVGGGLVVLGGFAVYAARRRTS